MLPGGRNRWGGRGSLLTNLVLIIMKLVHCIPLQLPFKLAVLIEMSTELYPSDLIDANTAALSA